MSDTDERFVVALDQGTTSSRAILVDVAGQIRGIAQHPFTQHFPHPGWVEHDPMEILSSQLAAFTELMVHCALEPEQIDSIGITNQRETTVIWDRESGLPVANAIVWQCRRTTEIIETMCADPEFEQQVVERTGLVPDAYFSASKIKWILNNVEGVRCAAEAGKLAFGTVDSWLLWSLTRGAVHASDPTNAARTMLYNIHSGQWDPWLLERFDIPASLLPVVQPSASLFGETAHPGIPAGLRICGVAGDQQAALFGQRCFSAGMAKNTYGTGCFLLMHTGDVACRSKHRLITTIAASPPPGPLVPPAAVADAPAQIPQSTAQTPQKTEYALEGSVFVAGALMQWLRDEMGLLETAPQSEAVAASVPDSNGVYVVPAFTGLGAPHWDAHARGAVYGLTRGTKRAHFVRAALESLAYQVYDLASAMQEDAGVALDVLRVDGGASTNDLLMQLQSDLLETSIVRPAQVESTALGAAFLAGLTTGFWQGIDDLRNLCAGERVFEPHMDEQRRREMLAGWHEAVTRTRSTS